MILIYFFYLQLIYCQALSNVFQSLTISNPSELSRPQDIRTATLDWRLKSGEAMANDKFTLTLPYVFRTKFGSSTLSLTADGKTFATCEVRDGSVYYDDTLLTCSVTEEIDTEEVIIVTGRTKFDFVFNAGGTTSDVDINAANYWTSGENSVSWGELSTEVEFDGGPFFAPSQDDASLVYYSRSTPQNYEQIYLLSNTCSGGIKTGKLAITTNSTFDCTLFDMSSTNDLNGFLFPKTFSSIRSTISCTDDKKTLMASFENIPEGYRAFLQGFMAYSKDTETVKHSYYSSLTCGNGKTITDSLNRVIEMVYGTQESEGNITTVATKTEHWRSTFTSTTTIPCPPGENTETVVIHVPSTEVITTCTGCYMSESSYNTESSSVLDTSITEISQTASSRTNSDIVSFLTSSTVSSSTISSTISSITISSSTIKSSTFTSITVSSSSTSPTTINSSTISSSSISSSSTSPTTISSSTISSSTISSSSISSSAISSSSISLSSISSTTTSPISTSSYHSASESSSNGITSSDSIIISFSSSFSISSSYSHPISSDTVSTCKPSSSIVNPASSTEVIVSSLLHTVSAPFSFSQKVWSSPAAPPESTPAASSTTTVVTTCLAESSYSDNEPVTSYTSALPTTAQSDTSMVLYGAESETARSHSLSPSSLLLISTSELTNVAEPSTRIQPTASDSLVASVSESPKTTTIIATVTNTVSQVTKSSALSSLSAQVSMPPWPSTSTPLSSIASTYTMAPSSLSTALTPTPSVYEGVAASLTQNIHLWLWAILLVSI